MIFYKCSIDIFKNYSQNLKNTPFVFPVLSLPSYYDYAKR